MKKHQKRNIFPDVTKKKLQSIKMWLKNRTSKTVRKNYEMKIISASPAKNKEKKNDYYILKTHIKISDY